jgi:hypothetical protein
MSNIFISYSHDDSAIANRLANDLLDKNYVVWIDNLNLPGGSDWEDEIMQGIDACDYFLIVWSSNIEGSTYSQKEKDRALSAGKTIIPLLLSGDASRIWTDIQHLQYIDISDYRVGFDKIIDQIPLPAGIQPPPDIKALIKQGDMTFNSATRLYRSYLSYGKNDDDAVGLLVERSEYGIQSFLVGRRKQKIEKPPQVQVFLNFSGNIDKDRFEDYLEYASEAHPNLWTVHVRGAITHTSRGLQYFLPDEKKVWEAAVHLAWRTIGKVSGESTPIHLYMNAPVALGAGFCAIEHFRREVTIYHANFTPTTAKERYFPVYQF